MIDQVLAGKYQVARLIGEGGMGAVYEATRTEDDERVAVKVINDDAVAKDEVLVTRFEREALAASKILSPHIVEIFDAGHDPDTGHPYMVMEMLDGENALQLLTRLGPLPPQLAIRIGIQTCEGLARAHEVGVVHRDIKPANLFLTDKGDEVVVKLLDFGVAKFKMDQASESQNQSLTRTGSMLGSPMYMSPEQARGLKTIDHRADIWSLGIVMYQLLVGKIPHDDIDGLGELIITICSEPPAPVNEVAPWVSAKLTEVISGALQLATDQRYQSADEMADALKGCLTGSKDVAITKDMLVPLDEEAKKASAAAMSHDQTVALDQAPVTAASTVALSPEELAEAAAKDRGEAPSAKGPDPEPPSIDPEQKRRDEKVLAKHRDAQRAALEAARLSDDTGSSGAGRYVMMLVVVVVLGVGAWFAYMNLMVADAGGAPAGSSAPDPGPSE
ncbi:MAG TPA: serine/threonine protein kinase [Polyangiaceae bacterium]|nr:serine/threonine protein kinase [Polyangiaceae bacterium]